MKKIGKKFSYITKIFLVLGLLFSNLSGLSLVFAYENDVPFGIEIKDNKIVINYNQEDLEDEDNIKITLKENYKYLDDTTEEEVNDSFSAIGSEFKNENGYEIDSPMLNLVVFDGLYELNVSLYNETKDEEIGTVNYSYNVEYESGLEVMVYDSEDNLITANEGLYSTDGDIKLVASILPGGLKPTDKFMLDGVEYTAKDLLGLEFPEDVVFGSLYGEYTLPVVIKVNEDTLEEMEFTKDIRVMYGKYEDNDKALNKIVSDNKLSDRYYFFSESNEGILYVYPNTLEGYSINDLFKILDEATIDGDIKYIISNSDSEDLEESYQEYLSTFDDTTTEEPMTREVFYQEVYVNNDVVIKLYNDMIELTYQVVVMGDLNNDLVINEEDVKVLIDEIIGAKDEAHLLASDVFKDDKLDAKDVAKLYGIYKNDTWNNDITLNEELTTRGELVIDKTDIVSGEEFSVRYILKVSLDKLNGLAGMVKYDEEMLELVGMESEETFIGNNYEGKFLYLSEEELTGILDEETQEYKEEEYTVLTLTFKAKKAGNTKIEIVDNELFNIDEYYDASQMEVNAEVIINASDDNTLASLTVAGQEIELVKDVLDYEIEVEYDQVDAIVEAITNNIAAEVSLIVAPDELSVGENEVSITVVAENGDELVYTVKVIRKEAPKEEEPTNMNYQNNNNDNTSNDDTNVEPTTPSDNTDNEPTGAKDEEKDGKLSRIIIIILILLVIAGLIYLIFKDDSDDEETKKTNKEIDKVKKTKEFTEEKKNTKNVKKGR